MRESFIFYKSFYEALKELTPEQRLGVFDLMCAYQFDENLPEYSGLTAAIFSLIKPQLDANNRRYENGKKGKEYGKLGGRPRKVKTPRKPLENPKETPNENVNENENENEEKKNIKRKKSGNDEYRPDGIPDDLWQDFSTLRKTKRAPITATAMKGIENEAQKAGYTIEQALRTMCQRGWTGFNHRWIQADKGLATESIRRSQGTLADARKEAGL